MASQEERDNFFSLVLLLFRVGNQRLREYFKTQWPIVYQRVKPGSVPPPWQDTPRDAKEMNKIQPTKLNLKFKDERTKFDEGNTNVWDLSLLTTVLKYSSLKFVLPSSPEEKALDDLKVIRNTLIGHAADAAIPNAEFNAAWNDVCNALRLFNATAADFQSVQDDVKKSLDVLYPMLQQCAIQEKDIQHSVDTIMKKVEQLQQTVEQQHTTQLEVGSRIESKVVLLLEHQGIQGQKRSSAEAQTGEDVQTTRFASASRERDYNEDSQRLKEAIASNTEYQTMFMAAQDVTSARTDGIFTDITVYYADKKQVKKEQAEELSRREQLQEYTKRSTGVKVKKCEDIFMDMKGENPKLLLTGKPGIGKTLFCEKVIRDWSINRLFQNENTPNIKFAYLLKFRQLSSDKEMNLQELLNLSPLLDDNSIIDDTLFAHLTKNPSEVLIIMDGFDELSEQHRKEIASQVFEEKYSNNSRAKMPITALCSKLIKGKLFKKAIVLVSSRPGESKSLRKISFDRYVEISGFSPEQVTEYVDKFFSEPEKEQTRNTIREHVEKNEDLVSFCHIPLLSFLLCWCLEWQISQSGITGKLPAKITDLYDEVVKVVVQKLHANLKYSEMSENSIAKIAQDTLGKLAKLAASLLKESKYIFNEEDLKKQNLTEDEIANLKVSGILHCVPGIRNSAFETKSELSFIHLTLQEFLAASSFVKTKEVPEKEEATGQTFVFMSGLSSREKDRELMGKIIQQITPRDDRDYVTKLLMVQCLYEYADDELTKQTINNLYDTYCRDNGLISFLGVTDVDMKYLSYLLDIIGSVKEQHPQPSRGHHTLHIGASPLTSFGVGVVCDSLVRHSFITELWLMDCSLDDKCVEKITDSLVNTGITGLDLQANMITDEGLQRIVRVIIRQDCAVEWLTLLGNDKITEECKEHVEQLVQKHKPSVELFIQMNN